MLYCFLDTNIFLEFRPLNEILWCKELNSAEVCLVVTSVVMRELDKHKSSKRRRKSKRAQDALRFLENTDVSGNHEICQNVSLHFERPEPLQDTLDANNLSTSVPDDILIAKAIEFAAVNQSHTVAVVSGDFGVRLKARGVNLCVPILDKFRLVPETDPLVKENQELRNELQKLQNARPKLEFGFRDEDGSTTRVLKLERGKFDTLTSEEEIQEAIRTECDLHKDPWNRQNNEFDLPRFWLNMPTSDLAREYRNDVDRWLNNDFRNYLIRISRYRACKSQNIVLPLLLKNTGSAPAEGTRVDIRVRGCRAILDEMPVEPAMPDAPNPADYVGYNPNAKRYVYFAGGGGAAWNQTQFNETPLELDTGVEHQLRFPVEKILHHDSYELGDHVAVIDKPPRYPFVIELEYQVITENHPEKLEGVLKVIIKQKET